MNGKYTIYPRTKTCDMKRIFNLVFANPGFAANENYSCSHQ
jgi:hypothetical protein